MVFLFVKVVRVFLSEVFGEICCICVGGLRIVWWIFNIGIIVSIVG